MYGGEGGGHGYVARGMQGVICLNDQGGSIMGTSVDVAGTLLAQEHGHHPIVCAGFQHKAGARAHGIGYEEERAPTLASEQLAAVYDARGKGDGKTACTLTGDHQSRVTDYTAIVMVTGQAGAEITQDASTTLNCNHEQPIIVTGVDCRNMYENEELSATLQAKENGGQSINYINPVRVGGQVRRLTPLECERLQGYPDGWTVLQEIGDMTDAEYEFWKSVLFEKEKRKGRVRLSETGVWEIWKYIEGKDEEDRGHWENTYKLYKHKGKSKMVKWYNKSFCKDSDSARYKALGNSIALPPWSWVLKRLCACYERDATMASLFDGIGGFPLIWERLNGPGSCLWASEIEEFPIAVTKARFDGKRRW